jgi:hypothetical protein
MVKVKPFDPKRSPFILAYVDDMGNLAVRQFDDLTVLATFVGVRKLTRFDFSIIHGELVKGVPEEILGDFEDADAILAIDEGSTITTLPPADMRVLIERSQA